MAKKPEYVDLISDATRQQRRRREETHVIAKTVFDEREEAPQPERRLSNWPPGRIAQWRMENLSAWKMKLKGWKFKDWS